MKTFLFAWKLYSAIVICSPICCIVSFQNKAAIKREFYSVKLVERITEYSHIKYYLGSPVVHCGSKWSKRWFHWRLKNILLWHVDLKNVETFLDVCDIIVCYLCSKFFCFLYISSWEYLGFWGYNFPLLKWEEYR